MKTVFMVGVRLIDIVNEMHAKSVYHLDLKDQNVAVGYGGEKEHLIYVIDFGMSLFIDEDGQEICGATANVPEVDGGESMRESDYLRRLDRASRIRDFVGILVTMMYLINPNTANEESLDAIGMESPDDFSSEGEMRELFSHFPAQFLQFLTYIHSLAEDTAPDTAVLKRILRRGLAAHRLMDDGMFEWMEE